MVVAPLSVTAENPLATDQDHEKPVPSPGPSPEASGFLGGNGAEKPKPHPAGL
jgi:hypothetical protein